MGDEPKDYVLVATCPETGACAVVCSATGMSAYPRRQVGVAQEREGMCALPNHFERGKCVEVVVAVPFQADAAAEREKALAKAGEIFSANAT